MRREHGRGPWARHTVGLTLSLALLLAAGAIHAAEPSVTVRETEVLDNYNRLVDRLASRISSAAGAAASGGGDGPAIYFDLNAALDAIPGFGSLAAADRALVRASKRTYELYRALGGQSVDRFAMVQRRDDRYYVGLDGEGGRWVATPEEALTVLVDQLSDFVLYRIPDSRRSIQCPFDYRCLLKATYTGDVETMAFVPRGTTVTLEMGGTGFEGGAGPPLLIVPPSFTVLDVTFVDGENIVARVSIDSTAELGLNVANVYNEAKSFRTVERYGIHVVAGAAELAALLAPLLVAAEAGEDAAATATDATEVPSAPVLAGTGEVEPLVDDHPAETAAASVLSATASGRLEATGDVDRFKIVVDQSATLTLTSDSTLR